MIFAFLLYDFAKHDRVDGDGLFSLGLAAFFEILIELAIFTHLATH